jgi:hypothetical protein
MSILPEGTQIWTRSFYGFSPEEDGYVGWTEASPRDRYAGRLSLICSRSQHRTFQPTSVCGRYRRGCYTFITTAGPFLGTFRLLQRRPILNLC